MLLIHSTDCHCLSSKQAKFDVTCNFSEMYVLNILDAERILSLYGCIAVFIF